MFGKKAKTQPSKTPIYKRKWFIVLIVLTLLGGCVNMCSGGSKSNDGQGEVVDEQPTADKQTVDDEQTAADSPLATDPEVQESEASSLTIVLTAGEENEYSKMRTMNAGTEFEESQLVYYVPEGKYKVTNTGEYRTQVNVYEGVTVNEEGWEEAANTGDILLLNAGETGEITVPDGYYIDIIEPARITLEQL